MNREHTDREYEEELRTLRDELLLMGAKVEEMIAGAILALVTRDSDLARSKIEADREIDGLEISIDEHCLRILARRQPVASDLRFITMSLKIVTDLERIGDLGVNICERAIDLNTEQPLKPYIDIPKMAELVQAMIRDALDAFVEKKADLAQAILERDRIVDNYYSQIFRELLTYMLEDPRSIRTGIKIQAIAKYLERIGDHAANLAEMVIFMVKGKDIRHMGRLAAKGKRPRGVLFVCTRNSARSQMAEGWAHKLFPPGVRIWSAGSHPGFQVDARAVQVMSEAGVDITKQWPKSLSDVPLGDIDTVISLCMEEECPMLPGELRRAHWSIPDPCGALGDEETVMQAFRQTRDSVLEQIKTFIESWN